MTYPSNSELINQLTQLQTKLDNLIKENANLTKQINVINKANYQKKIDTLVKENAFLTKQIDFLNRENNRRKNDIKHLEQYISRVIKK